MYSLSGTDFQLGYHVSDASVYFKLSPITVWLDQTPHGVLHATTVIWSLCVKTDAAQAHLPTQERVRESENT